MVKIGSVELNGSLGWSDRFSGVGVAQVQKRTLGGRMVSFSGALVGGREITLVASQESGWLTHTMVLQLTAMSFVPGVVYDFIFGDESHRVIFNHSNSPAVTMSPLSPKQNPAAGDYFIGTIKLLTVE